MFEEMSWHSFTTTTKTFGFKVSVLRDASHMWSACTSRQCPWSHVLYLSLSLVYLWLAWYLFYPHCLSLSLTLWLLACVLLYLLCFYFSFLSRSLAWYFFFIRFFCVDFLLFLLFNVLFVFSFLIACIHFRSYLTHKYSISFWDCFEITHTA